MPRLLDPELKTQIIHYYKQRLTPIQIARLLQLDNPEAKGRKLVHNLIKRNNIKRPALKRI